jgi:hypothetical protein
MEKQEIKKLKNQLEVASNVINLKEDKVERLIKIKEQENETDEEFDNEIKDLKKERQSITNKYKIPKEYIKSVAKGFNKAFIFLGKTGIGKTYLTRQVLAKLNVDFVESRGVNSPMALYEFLYEHRHEDSLIVFDDVNGLVNNPNAYSIMLGILWEKIANWNSTSEKLKIPKKFIFNGKIIIIANKLEGENSDVVKSRCLNYNLKLNNEDLIKMMYEIAKQKHSKLKYRERIKIVKFIEENSNKSVRFDLRTQKKVEQLYLYDEKNWEELALPLLEKDDDYSLLINCLNKHKKIKQAEIEFCKKTGKHRATFYRMKKELKK